MQQRHAIQFVRALDIGGELDQSSPDATAVASVLTALRGLTGEHRNCVDDMLHQPAIGLPQPERRE
jgi:hypothetical protein